MVKGANGILRIPLNKRQYFIATGGPYRNKPLVFRGVKMAEEISASCDVDIPTRDFDVPNPQLMARGLKQAVELILMGEPVWIGCMGGVGRTGLTLALIAKAFGVKEPVKYVRAHYAPHAVETPQQMAYVKKFRIPDAVTRMIKRERRSGYSFWKNRFWRNNLTDFSAVFGWQEAIDNPKPSVQSVALGEQTQRSLATR